MEYLTIDEIAKHYWVRRGHAIHLAAADDWRLRRDADGTVRYHRDDVEATLGPRIAAMLTSPTAAG